MPDDSDRTSFCSIAFSGMMIITLVVSLVSLTENIMRIKCVL